MPPARRTYAPEGVLEYWSDGFNTARSGATFFDQAVAPVRQVWARGCALRVTSRGLKVKKILTRNA